MWEDGGRWIKERVPEEVILNTSIHTFPHGLHTVNQVAGKEYTSPRAHAKALGQRLACVRTV